ncbi:glutamate dehydrogenase [Marinococcus halophilus]|uniref:Glutamate dehydrogenase n=1 Tax=Marinococcus halophilus TaxID=1371 RepID=A0A510YD33_MARHA|nr:Glu/Leu/Phe/Val dehydrogenase [Marinococcus halophilus]OZT80106.1 glutamate dehydrogenase [Marinococcus halophilus]GEK60267.1 catabolic NAD-specific glutamate dehydrogenase RocG [Marinococcus halophilus]
MVTTHSGTIPSSTTLYTHTQELIKEALNTLGYSEHMYDLLKEPLRTMIVRIPVRMDDGKTKMFTGYRAQHNDAVGPTKGGIRFHPDVTIEEVNTLSLWMTLKCGLVNLPYGGGKGGIVCDPRQMSLGELERLSRGYVQAISQIVGPTKDIPAPDVYTNAQVMAWMMDEYSRIREFDSPGFITGKPLELGGSLGRESATAQGVVVAVEEALQLKNMSWDQSKVIIQGFGNAGSYLAKLLYDKGASIVGISDVLGGIYDEQGLPVYEIAEQRDSFGMVTNRFENTISNEELLEQKCDILIPAAVSNQITYANAHRIQAKIVAEAANGPTTFEATKILHSRDILLVPDVLASAGGVTVSYFEWVQNNQGYYWALDEIETRLNHKLRNAFRSVYHMAQEKEIDMRTAAYIVGIRRIAAASEFRGWV